MGAEQFFVARQPSCRYPYADQDLGSRKPRRWKFCVRDANRFKKQKVIRKLVRKPFSGHGLAPVYARSDRLAGPIFGGAGMRWECRGNAPGTHWERRPNARVLASNGPFCASNARVLEFRQFMRVGHVRSRLPAGDLSQRPTQATAERSQAIRAEVALIQLARIIHAWVGCVEQARGTVRLRSRGSHPIIPSVSAAPKAACADAP